KMTSQSPSPLSQTCLTRVDLLPASYECYDNRPTTVPIHNVEHDLRLGAIAFEFSLRLLTIPGPLSFVEYYDAIRWRIGRSEMCVDETVNVLNKRGNPAAGFSNRIR